MDEIQAETKHQAQCHLVCFYLKRYIENQVTNFKIRLCNKAGEVNLRHGSEQNI